MRDTDAALQLAASGGTDAAYRTAASKYRVSCALEEGVQPGTLATARALAAAIRAMESEYGRMLYVAEWEEALALRALLGETIERLGRTLEAAKKEEGET